MRLVDCLPALQVNCLGKLHTGAINVNSQIETSMVFKLSSPMVLRYHTLGVLEFYIPMVPEQQILMKTVSSLTLT